MGLFGNNEEKKDSESETDESAGKYNEPCALCSKAPTDKHWAGQFFHKKCFRKMRKGASKMI